MRKFAVLAASMLILTACSKPETGKGGDASGPIKGAATGPSLNGPLLATPGLWRTTTTVGGRQVLGANLACVDLTSQKAGHDLGQTEETGCRAPVRRSIAGGFAYEVACEKDGLKTMVAGEVTGDARRVVMRSTTRLVGPDGDAAPPTEVVVENVHVGPCPAGMTPGQSTQEGVAAR